MAIPQRPLVLDNMILYTNNVLAIKSMQLFLSYIVVAARLRNKVFAKRNATITQVKTV